MKTKKILSVLMAITVAIGCLTPIIGSAEDSGTSTSADIYKASDAWNSTQNGDENWTWEYSDYTTNGVLKELTAYVDANAIFGADPVNTEATAENRNIAGTAWKSGTDWNNAGVGKYWMIPLIKSTGVTTEQKQMGRV